MVCNLSQFTHTPVLFCSHFQLGLTYTLVKDFDSAIQVCALCVCVHVCVSVCVCMCVCECVSACVIM